MSIKKNSTIVIGNNVTIISGLMLNPLGRNIRSMIRIDEGATVKIGDNTGMSNVCLWAKKQIMIGNNVTIGADCLIFDSDMHSLEYRDRRSSNTDVKNTKSSAVTIKDDAFIGTRSIIAKGVTIGYRSIVAAGSVVVMDIPDDEVWGGNPAKFIRKLEI